MAEKDWRETMGAPFAEAEEPQYDVGAIRRATTDTPAHAEMFNGVFQQLIDNTAAVKRMAEGTQETLEREISNPNLLENWDFRNPVNRNGKGEYTGKGVWTADRWITSGNQGIKVTIQNRNLMITSETDSNYKGISQPLMKGTELFAGKTVTISALVEENAVGKIEMFIGNTSNPSNAGILYGLSVFTEDAGLITSTVTLPNTFSEPILTFTLGVSPGVSGGHLGSFKVVAAKLELGDHQTLARQKDSGEWEIIDPPNYDLQYALCSQYNPANGEWQGFAMQEVGTFTPELWAGDVKLRHRFQYGNYVKTKSLCFITLHVAAYHDNNSGRVFIKGFPYPFLYTELQLATRIITSTNTVYDMLFIGGNVDTAASTTGTFVRASTGAAVMANTFSDQLVCRIQGVYYCG